MNWTPEEYDALLKRRKTAPAASPRDVSRGTQASPPKGFDAFLGLLKANGLPAPELEYYFHPVRRFKADYAWPEHKLIVERQGGVWAKVGTRAKKAHTEPMAILRDYEKANLAQLAGWTYLQYTPEQLDKGLVIETLRIRLA